MEGFPYVALNHHEKWDGSGYLAGFAGDDIPLAARIVAIADVFDALTMERSYKRSWSIEEAFAHIQQDANKHFDPHLVECFLAIEDELRDIKKKWSAVAH